MTRRGSRKASGREHRRQGIRAADITASKPCSTEREPHGSRGPPAGSIPRGARQASRIRRNAGALHGKPAVFQHLPRPAGAPVGEHERAINRHTKRDQPAALHKMTQGHHAANCVQEPRAHRRNFLRGRRWRTSPVVPCDWVTKNLPLKTDRETMRACAPLQSR